MHKFLIAALFLLPVTALAGENCKHSQPRDLQLELAGVKAVVFEIGSNTLRLQAVPGSAGALQGRACAASADLLQGLTLTQKRVDDKLIVTLREDRPLRISFGKNYSYLDITGNVPDSMPVQLKVGSGDAEVTGAPVLSVDVGSGDVVARRIRGLAAASVGSGDIALEDIGSLQVFSIGSGDISAKQVRGDVKVGSIGSGDFELDRADGDVEIGSIGSGDADLRNVAGNVSVGSVGSGSVDARDVDGDFSVRSAGSGSLKHSNVSGRVDLPRKR